MDIPMPYDLTKQFFKLVLVCFGSFRMFYYQSISVIAPIFQQMKQAIQKRNETANGKYQTRGERCDAFLISGR